MRYATFLGQLSTALALIATSACAGALTEPQPADGSIRLSPEDDVASIVAAAPEGAVFRLVDGNFRSWSVVPKNGQAFIAEGSAAVLDGSMPVDAWINVDGRWVAKIPPEGWNAGRARPGSPALSREDLFIDEQLLLQVASLDDLKPGRWYRDGTTAYIVDDPKGRLVELSVVPHAFAGEAENVVLKGLIVRQYASPAQSGAIEGAKGERWTLIDVSAAHNHSRGLSLGPSMAVEGGAFVWNGQLGIGGRGHDVTVKHAEIAHNNFAGYDHWWEAGGMKITKSDNLKFIANYVHHNDGPGLWLDWDNRYALIEGNLIAANRGLGLQYEASREGRVKDNIVARNDQSGYDDGFWGAEILVQNSSGIEVTGNVVVVEYNAGIGVTQQDRGGGDYGDHLAIDTVVTDNTVIYLNKNGKSGAWGDFREPELYQGTRFDRNRYIIPSGSEANRFWEQAGRHLDWEEVRSMGWETNGALEAVDEPTRFEPNYLEWYRTNPRGRQVNEE